MSARKYAQPSSSTWAAVRSVARGLTMLSPLKGNVRAVPTDVTSADAVGALAAAAYDRFGAVHLLCNNAGVFQAGVVGPIRIYKRARPADAPRPLHDPEQVHAEHVAAEAAKKEHQ